MDDTVYLVGLMMLFIFIFVIAVDNWKAEKALVYKSIY